MFSGKICCCLGAAVCVLSPLLIAAAQEQKPVYQSFEVSGSVATYPLSINARMTVTGYYISKSGGTHGFVREGDGTVSRFDVAGSSSTRPDSINFAGEITGTYIAGANSPIPGMPQGFVRDADGKITVFGKSVRRRRFRSSVRAQPRRNQRSRRSCGQLLAPSCGSVRLHTLTRGSGPGVFPEPWRLVSDGSHRAQCQRRGCRLHEQQ